MSCTEVAPTRQVEAVRDAAAVHLFTGPFLVRSFQNEDVVSVHNEVAVVVVELMVIGTVAALAVDRQQLRDDIHRPLRCGCPLQGKAQVVHADERVVLLVVRALREDGLVANAHAVLIHAHLRAPEPHGPGDEDGFRVRDLRDRCVGHLQFCFIMVFCGDVLEDLRLVRAAVTVLCENGASFVEETHGITHRQTSSTHVRF